MIYTKINLMIPTFDRTEQLTELLDSSLRKASDPNRIAFSFCVNESDRKTLNLVERRYWPKPENVFVTLERTRQPNLALYYNMLYKMAWPDADDMIVSMVGDDMVWMTSGYDEKILDKINECEGKAIVYCDDDFIAHDQLCVNLFTTRRMIPEGMPFMCPFFAAEMIDVVWYKIGKMTGTLRYLDKVILRHNHGSAMPQDKRDNTFNRLMPLRQLNNTEPMRRKALAYATNHAGKLILSGIGEWSKL